MRKPADDFSSSGCFIYCLKLSCSIFVAQDHDHILLLSALSLHDAFDCNAVMLSIVVIASAIDTC
jgi:hypothetical protein